MAVIFGKLKSAKPPVAIDFKKDMAIAKASMACHHLFKPSKKSKRK